MAVGSSAMCGTFKTEAMAGIHFWTPHTRTGSSAIGADTFKIAMFTNSSSIDADTTGYTTSNEVSGTNYTAGGNSLGSVTLALADNSSSVPTAFLDFADSTWSTSTISSARGALIYNDTASGDPAVCVLDFGGDKTATSGTFTIQFPAFSASAAILRVT